MAAVLDEAMGTVCWDNGKEVLAGEISVRFCAPLPLDCDTSLTAEITGISGRKVFVKAALASVADRPAESTVYTTAKGTFINMDAKFAQYLQELTPMTKPE